MQQRKIKFLDTTLRDGEQTPGVNLNLQDKLRLAGIFLTVFSLLHSSEH